MTLKKSTLEKKAQSILFFTPQALVASHMGVGARTPAYLQDLSDATRLRDSIRSDLQKQTNLMKEYVKTAIPEQQSQVVANPPPDRDSFSGFFDRTPLEWLDWSTRWGLTVCGAMLLLGFFTRLACLGGGVFLIMEFLSNSPWPWLPKSPMAEGNYVFINKNVVELCALMVLLTTRSGRWVGLDAIISYFLFGKKEHRVAEKQVGTTKGRLF
jgi:uncharacterized membrane protein YphA (DoxX/SURF4 family)